MAVDALSRRLASQAVLVLDGAMGTQLQARGLEPGGCPELWNLERPTVVEAIHRDYLAAGAEILETNTFGGNRARLDDYGLGDRTRDVCRRATEIALGAAEAFAAATGQPRALVAGSLGPTGKLMAPTGDLRFDQALELFREAAGALREAGADCLIVETMFDLDESRAATTAAVETGLPVISQLTFGRGVRTITGVDVPTMVRTLEGLGARVVGVNCSTGPEEMAAVVRELVAHATVPVSALPNAGLPEYRDGRVVYPMTPEAFAEAIAGFVELGARLVGGCCGTTPEFIRRVRARVKPAG